jgi:hypothetical protein
MVENKEFVHQASADEAWQESVFLAWRDPNRGIGGVRRLRVHIPRTTQNQLT